jgi:hypothetical protein
MMRDVALMTTAAATAAAAAAAAARAEARQIIMRKGPVAAIM